MKLMDIFSRPSVQPNRQSQSSMSSLGQQHLSSEQAQRPQAQQQQQQQPPTLQLQTKLTQQQLNQINEQQQQQRPSQQFTPILIAVEPRNDESVRCDCRNCQFFSGWCCMPCALLVIIMIIVVYATMKGSPTDPDDDDLTSTTRSLFSNRGAYETIS